MLRYLELVFRLIGTSHFLGKLAFSYPDYKWLITRPLFISQWMPTMTWSRQRFSDSANQNKNIYKLHKIPLAAGNSTAPFIFFVVYWESSNSAHGRTTPRFSELINHAVKTSVNRKGPAKDPRTLQKLQKITYRPYTMQLF